MNVDPPLLRQGHKGVGERLQRTQVERRRGGQPLAGQSEEENDGSLSTIHCRCAREIRNWLTLRRLMWL